MSDKVHITTDRLILRDWTDTDAEPFAALNADPRLMEFFPAALSRAESDAFLARIRAGIAERGYGLYATEEKRSGKFIGYVGLAPVSFDAPFTPATEIGWRLSRTAWGTAMRARPPVPSWRTPSRTWGLRRWCHSRRSGTCPRGG